MPLNRVRAASLAAAALLACCRSEPPSAPAASLAQPAQAACRVGPDGAPLPGSVLADRGIGGTGAPILTADRGIGGTGAPILTADRGIGGTGITNSNPTETGIVGVITGFASVCLAGQEVALPPGVPIAIGTQPASADALRAGQVAVIEAADSGPDLSARRIIIRYEVVGPVERVQGDELRVAGQEVALSPQTWGIRPARGDWVAVSGLHRADGTIAATRIERRTPDQIIVHGRLLEQAGGLHIGALSIRRDPDAVALIGQEVTVAGIVGQNGELQPFSMTPDLLAFNPAAFFGPRVSVVLIESFAVLDAGRLRLPGFSAPAPGLSLDGQRRAVFRFERVGGALRAVGLAGHVPEVAPTPRFEPAPVPNRSIHAPGGRSVRGQPRRHGRFTRDREDPNQTGPNQNGPDDRDMPPPGEFPPRAR